MNSLIIAPNHKAYESVIEGKEAAFSQPSCDKHRWFIFTYVRVLQVHSSFSCELSLTRQY